MSSDDKSERNSLVDSLRAEAAARIQAAIDSLSQQFGESLSREIEVTVDRTQKLCDDHLSSREGELARRIRQLEDIIEGLRGELTQEKQEKEKARAQTERVVERLGLVRQRSRQRYSQPFSLQRIFHVWRQQLVRQRRCRAIEQVVCRAQCQLLLTRSFSALSARHRSERFQREQTDLSARYHTLHSSVSAKGR
ncbi:hypothetical protein EON64_15990 [archaeon]|nr:MAG: hypothetical protein EON64_15990 [archaeon]